VAAFEDGKWSQAFPYFGTERRGAPVTAFSSIIERKIWVRSQFYEPDYVIMQDWREKDRGCEECLWTHEQCLVMTANTSQKEDVYQIGL
jgi:Pyruvate/2-oxoacid:ferredoxin oxidoreductase gamma subunit